MNILYKLCLTDRLRSEPQHMVVLNRYFFITLRTAQIVYASGQEQVAGSCESGNEPCGSTKFGTFLLVKEASSVV